MTDKLRGMNDGPLPIHLDPEGLLPADTKIVEKDHVEKRLVIENLTDEQIDSVGNAIAAALRPYKSRTTRFISKGVQLAAGSVIMTGLAWVTAYIITHFPTTNR